MSGTVLVQYCKVEDYDASTGVCSAPFFGPVSSFPPPLDAAEGLLISAAIVGCWSVGYMIRQARRASGG